MEFDSPEVMKDFPGLYSAEKRKGNDSDYNDETEKATKKEMIIGKRKDKKDKDKGYAALEGESSDDASPCKAKKYKTFKFSKSKDKEKENIKDKTESRPKKKNKLQKFPKGFGNKCNPEGTTLDLAEDLPIFGVDLIRACERGKCHDSIAIPLPVRECIDYVEEYGLNFEHVYKISGPKNKVHQIKKMYNNREPVRISKYDVPTATSVLKAFLRELPEPVLTNELLVRFEEVGAILNSSTREKHLKALVNSLPPENQNLLTILVIHLHNVAQREQVNKMSKQNLAQALSHTLHMSSRLLQALITHRMDLYSDTYIIKYLPPLEAGSPYPDDPEDIRKELSKLNSALDLIHWEMQQGFCSERRQDQLWDLQRIITDLKRKLKKANHPHQPASEEAEEIGQQAVDSKADKEGATSGYYNNVVDSDEIIQNSEQWAGNVPCVCPDHHLFTAFKIEAATDSETEPVEEVDQQVCHSDSNSEEDMEQPEVSSDESVGPVHSASQEASGPGYQRMTGDNRPRESKGNHDSSYQNKSSGSRNECEQQASISVSEKGGYRPKDSKETVLSLHSKSAGCRSDFEQQAFATSSERSGCRPRDSRESNTSYQRKSSGGRIDVEQQATPANSEITGCRPRDSREINTSYQRKSSGGRIDVEQQATPANSEITGCRPRDSREINTSYQRKSSGGRIDVEQQATPANSERTGCRPRDSRESSSSHQEKPFIIKFGPVACSGNFERGENELPARQIASGALARTFSETRGDIQQKMAEKECICTMTGFAEGVRYAEKKSAEQREATEFVSVDDPFVEHCAHYNVRLFSLRAKNQMLIALMNSLTESIEQEKEEAEKLKKRIESYEKLKTYKHLKLPRNYEHVRQLLLRENHMLEIKKIQLVRHIMEYKEHCVDMEAEVQAAERRRSHE